MCGIYFTCSDKESVDPDDAALAVLRARGPDSLKIHHARIWPTKTDDTSTLPKDPNYYLTFASSVLSLRGNHVYAQPLVDPSTGSVLCWNGEAWRINGCSVRGNDTEQIFELLLNASHSDTGGREAPEVCPTKIAEVLTRIAGPYALVYYDAVNSIVYYARDRMGRRSLLLNETDSQTNGISISSVGLYNSPSIEVPTSGLHYIDLQASTLKTNHVPWLTPNPSINEVSPQQDMALSSVPSSDAVVALTQQLSEAIRLRVIDVPSYTANTGRQPETPSRIAILFSGGLDCTLLARIAHDVLPADEPIDLLNVAFENPRTIKAAASQSNKDIPSSTFPPATPYEACPDRITARQSFAELTEVCPNRTWRLVAIDVPYATTLAHRDTVINLMSPHNTEMDLSITLALYFAARGQGQSITFHPHQAYSIVTTNQPAPLEEPKPHTTTSRVLLSGLGADELFAGYARHSASFTRAGYTALNAELNLDISRIGSRNLGRDDRVLAHWGREVRYPFLDEEFVRFALALPVWEKTGFRVGKQFDYASEEQSRMEGGEETLDPAKMVLRLAAWRLGMKRVAREKKRAIQFGARTAKMVGGRTKGTDLLVPLSDPAVE